MYRALRNQLSIGLCVLQLFLYAGLTLTLPAHGQDVLHKKHSPTHLLPLLRLPASLAERQQRAKKLLRTSLTLAHHYAPGYGTDGDIPFFGEYAVLLNRAGKKQQAQKILRGLVPKALQAKEKTEICGALIWIARCQEAAGFRREASQMLLRARDYAVRLTPADVVPYAEARPHQMQPLTAIAFMQYRSGERDRFQQTMQIALHRAAHSRYSGTEYAEIAYTYALVEDMTAAGRMLLKLPTNSTCDSPIGQTLTRMAHYYARRGDISPVLRAGERFGRKAEDFITDEVEAIQQSEKKDKQEGLPKEPTRYDFDLAVAYARRGNRNQAITYARKYFNDYARHLQGIREYNKHHEQQFVEDDWEDAMELLRNVPYLPEANTRLQGFLKRMRHGQENQDRLLNIGRTLEARGDRNRAAYCYLRALGRMYEVIGPGDEKFAEINQNLLRIGDVYCGEPCEIDSKVAFVYGMAGGKELIRRMSVPYVEVRGRKANSAWILLGAAQVMLNSSPLFVNHDLYDMEVFNP